MTLNEFKYWLEGYSESFKDGVPSKEQWEKIREQLDRIYVVGSFDTNIGSPALPSRTERVYPTKDVVFY